MICQTVIKNPFAAKLHHHFWQVTLPIANSVSRQTQPLEVMRNVDLILFSFYESRQGVQKKKLCLSRQAVHKRDRSFLYSTLCFSQYSEHSGEKNTLAITGV